MNLLPLARGAGGSVLTGLRDVAMTVVLGRWRRADVMPAPIPVKVRLVRCVERDGFQWGSTVDGDRSTR